MNTLRKRYELPLPPPPRTIVVDRITPLNYKTRHPSPPIMQTEQITPLSTVLSGF